jgi:hypothetical protein
VSEQPAWEKDIIERRRQGEALVLREVGRSVTSFTRKQLVEVLRDEQYARPPRLHSQDKATLVADIQRWVLTERCGASLLARLKEQAA